MSPINSLVAILAVMTAVVLRDRRRGIAELKEISDWNEWMEKERAKKEIAQRELEKEMAKKEIAQRKLERKTKEQKQRGITKFKQAAKTGDCKAIDRMFKRPGGLAGIQTQDLSMAILFACGGGHVGVVRRLLRFKHTFPLLDSPWCHEWLRRAAANGHIDVVIILLEETHPVLNDGSGLSTALCNASRSGHIDIVNVLLEQNPLYNLADALSCAVRGGWGEVVSVLLAAGAEVDCLFLDGTALTMASRKGHIEVVRELLSAGADVNLTSMDGCTPLGGASQEGHIEVVRELLSAGADVDVLPHITGGTTALSAASAEGHVDVVIALLAAGANLDLRSFSGFTPLLYACQNGHETVAKLLITAGADVNCQMSRRMGALSIVCENGSAGLAKLLITAGAIIDIQPDVLTDLAWSIRYHNFAVANVLIGAGADLVGAINALVDSGMSDDYCLYRAYCKSIQQRRLTLLMTMGRMRSRGSGMTKYMVREVDSYL